jgi:hypothetical protein
MTSSFQERNPELKKNTRRNRGTESDKKKKKKKWCGEQEGEANVS